VVGLTDVLLELLDGEADGLPEQDVVARARARLGPGASRGPVTKALARDPRFVKGDRLGKPIWRIGEDVERDRRAVRAINQGHDDASHGLGIPVDAARPLDGLGLRDWQVDAFATWVGGGCRGVVEAITGAGKTRLAIAAVRAALARGGRVLVLVPTLDLQDQWGKELRTFIPGAKIGRLGGGGDDDLHDNHVLIATPHSAAAVDVDLPPGALGLLVADEAHRYGAPTWGAALRDAFQMRLALTATYERSDDGLIDVLGPYFGGIIHRYGYADAKRDGVIAPFRVGLVGTSLDGHEQQAYDKADARIKQLRGALLGQGWPRNPLEMIARAAAVVGANAGTPPGRASREVADARGFLAALRERRDVAAQAAGKLDVVRIVAPALLDRRTLVFTDTVEQAEQATKVLVAAGVVAEEIHGSLDSKRRKIRMAQFRNGNLQCVVAPRVLDEGVDVPEADVAVVLAAFRSRRQMVQRLGRVLRVKEDGREAALLVVHATGTREDPAKGAHEDFLGEVRDVAREVVLMDADSGPGAVIGFVVGGDTGGRRLSVPQR
jgi:superfamily II DNA or RNA helicase